MIKLFKIENSAVQYYGDIEDGEIEEVYAFNPLSLSSDEREEFIKYTLAGLSKVRLKSGETDYCILNTDINTLGN